MTNDAANNVEVLLLTEADEKAPAVEFSALLHVAVPPAADLRYIGAPAAAILKSTGMWEM